ncbi:hypothetical protein OH76DRAFT_1412751 [Lentinus brumalis]|uniref:Uncharacterized protein n=1 Tax=Lentinus brumalis TaxID=2498619 RepID=A0A371CK98_9APHY|nr:hypothetical protein OH76DRAFT_1412751 [Polyporus brumalis]
MTSTNQRRITNGFGRQPYVGDAGNVHLGPNNGLFVPIASHEMHCGRASEPAKRKGSPY